MSVSSAIVAKGAILNNRSGNSTAQRTRHIHQFGYSSEDPVNKRMQNPSYLVGTPFITRNRDVEKIIAAVESLTPKRGGLSIRL
ncbi:hypothetical protein BKA56DRAFT_733799 [Ilyonectria sp. MPI-CAGE-AT-0026]|nr:hypothetical protein BKA56DRAFT_733799 [Ilyonectria sp. MPI-CAGE-AT-0026]